MKKTAVLLLLSMTVAISAFALLHLNPAGVKWEESYTFNRCNVFETEIYAKNNELMRTIQFRTYYQSKGENFAVKSITGGKGNDMETVIDKVNQVAIQMFGTGGGATPLYNAGGFKYPEDADLKKLELVSTDESRQILGHNCKKYTYTYKKIFGEVWITEDVKLSNDLGVFRACKMAALHNTLSEPGFVMEMTTEDARGGKTVMKTISLENAETYTISFTGVEISKAINRVNYYTF